MNLCYVCNHPQDNHVLGLVLPCHSENGTCMCPGFLVRPDDYVSRISEDARERINLKPDMVDHPAHYTDGKIEVWDYIIDKNLTYCLGNVVKYVSRAGKKDPSKHIEDLKKAKAYLDREIKRVEAALAEVNDVFERNRQIIEEETNDPTKVIGLKTPRNQVVFADRFTPPRSGKQRQMICDQCWQAVKFKHLAKHAEMKHPESNGYRIAVG